MAEDTTISDAIKANAAGPKRAQGDSGSMEQHSIPDQIAADKHLASKTAMAGRRLAIRTFRTSQPGAI